MSDSFETSWTVARQAPLWMGFSRQEHWNGLPFPSPGDLPDPGTEPVSPTWQAAFLPLNHLGSPMNIFRQILIFFVCADLLCGVVIITYSFRAFLVLFILRPFLWCCKCLANIIFHSCLIKIFLFPVFWLLQMICNVHFCAWNVSF